ncbi:MAG: hypothetical protein Q8L34_06440 [Candidatus Woesearchaeota archaeon]|nr:hypothetical protein [Candidatus Woesearchaeota archaeon]
MKNLLQVHKNRVNHLDRLRKEYGINKFRFLERGDQKKVELDLDIPRTTIKRAQDEARILSLFPTLAKSRVTSLSTIKTQRELIQFTKENDIYKLSARALYKKVKEFRKSIEENPRLLLTDLEYDLLIGTTIGDANVRQRNKNCMFRVGHTVRQKKYVEWKQEILNHFKTQGIKLSQKMLNGYLINTYNLDINTHYVFNYFRRLFYDKEGIKHVTKEILDQINPRSLSIWLCDDGSYARKQKYIIFCTNSFTLEEHQLIKRWFEEKYNLSPTIGFRDKKYYYLRFKVDDTAKLVEIVRPFIIPSMRYKIGEQNE